MKTFLFPQVFDGRIFDVRTGMLVGHVHLCVLGRAHALARHVHHNTRFFVLWPGTHDSVIPVLESRHLRSTLKHVGGVWKML